MQKLVFRNANGIELNLTSDPFGITEWEGFSADDLNIQSQQVPFQDGAVFLDGLLGERELTVTVAMQDNNNLETRYRLRREMIKALNPKLGEGVLIYTNDFLSKQIHCIPQLPVFENHNSNDSGTPKASCTFTACNPYWEELEDTEITFQIGEQPVIENEGDVPCQIEMDWLTSYVQNPKVTNITKDKFIKYNGDLTESLKINTKIGEKSVVSQAMDYELETFGGTGYDIIYSEKIKKFVRIGNQGDILTSSDGINWEVQDSNTRIRLKAITYSEYLGMFLIIAYEPYTASTGTTIITSPDAVHWTVSETIVTGFLDDVVYSEQLHLFVAGGSTSRSSGGTGLIYTSPDGVTWTSRTIGGVVTDICYSEEVGLFVAINSSAIYTSPNGITWTSRANVGGNDVIYSKREQKFIVLAQTLHISSDGITWEDSVSDVGGNVIIDSEELGLFVVVGTGGIIKTSPDGITWTSHDIGYSEYQLMAIAYSSDTSSFITVGVTRMMTSTNGLEWEDVIPPTFGQTIFSICYSEELNLYVGVTSAGRTIKSTDGINWEITSRETQNTDLRSVVFAKDLMLFVAVGFTSSSPRLAVIQTSPDGVNWTVRSNGDYEYLYKVAYSEELHLFVAVGGYDLIITSSDGITWTRQDSGTSNVWLTGVDYLPNIHKFFALGGSMLTSSDGINWETVTGMGGWHKIVYIDNLGLYILLGEQKITTSYDGINWTDRQIPVDADISNHRLRDIAYSENLSMFKIVGETRTSTSGNSLVILKSSDGLNWVTEKVDSANFDLYCVLFSKKLDSFLTGGTYGMILKSKFELAENMIAHISMDSDIGLNLAVGENKLKINKTGGNMIVRIKYRQKYIGV